MRDSQSDSQYDADAGLYPQQECSQQTLRIRKLQNSAVPVAESAERLQYLPAWSANGLDLRRRFSSPDELTQADEIGTGSSRAEGRPHFSAKHEWPKTADENKKSYMSVELRVICFRQGMARETYVMIGCTVCILELSCRLTEETPRAFPI